MTEALIVENLTVHSQSTPVLFDINNPEKRAEEGITENFTAVQFSKVDGDDASCLNLNRISQPAILGVDPQALKERFSFAAKIGEIEKTDPWLALNQISDDGTIPAIADQTVIQWGLGMKVGDTTRASTKESWMNPLRCMSQQRHRNLS